MGYLGYSWNTEPTPDPSVVEYVLRDDRATVRSNKVSLRIGANGRLAKNGAGEPVGHGSFLHGGGPSS